MMSHTAAKPTIADMRLEAQNYRTSLESLMEMGRALLGNPSMEDASATAFQVLAENVLEQADHQQDLTVVEGVEEPAAKVELIMQDVLTPRLTEVEAIEEALQAKDDAGDSEAFQTSEHATRASQEELVYSMETLGIHRTYVTAIRQVLSMESVTEDIATVLGQVVVRHFEEYVSPLGISMESIGQTQVLGEKADAVERIEAIITKAHETVVEQAEVIRAQAQEVGSDTVDRLGELIDKHREENPSGVKLDDDVGVTTIDSDLPQTDSSDEESGDDAELDGEASLSDDENELVEAEDESLPEDDDTLDEGEEESEELEETSEEDEFEDETESDDVTEDDLEDDSEGLDEAPDLTDDEFQDDDADLEEGSDDPEEEAPEEEELDDDLSEEELDTEPDDTDDADLDVTEEEEEDPVLEEESSDEVEEEEELDESESEDGETTEVPLSDDGEESTEEEEEVEEEEDDDEGELSNESAGVAMTWDADVYGEDAARVRGFHTQLLQYLNDHGLLTTEGQSHLDSTDSPDFVLSSDMMSDSAAEVLAKHHDVWVAGSLRDGQANLFAFGALLGL